MRKSEKRRIKRIRESEKIFAARRHVRSAIGKLGYAEDALTTEKVLNVVNSLSNKDLKTIANLGGSKLINGFEDNELVRLATDEVAARAMNLQKE